MRRLSWLLGILLLKIACRSEPCGDTILEIYQVTYNGQASLLFAAL